MWSGRGEEGRELPDQWGLTSYFELGALDAKALLYFKEVLIQPQIWQGIFKTLTGT